MKPLGYGTVVSLDDDSGAEVLAVVTQYDEHAEAYRVMSHRAFMLREHRAPTADDFMWCERDLITGVGPERYSDVPMEPEVTNAVLLEAMAWRQKVLTEGLVFDGTVSLE